MRSSLGRSAAVTLLVTAGLLGHTGCAVSYQKDLALGEAALDSGSFAWAQNELEAARRKADEAGLDDPRVDLLLAEAELQGGDLARARTLAERWAEDPVAGAYAAEILGKAALREGDFEAAETQLRAARSGHGDPRDRERAEDLASLTRGLAAYASGDLAGARASWDQIADAALKSEIHHIASSAGSSQ